MSRNSRKNNVSINQISQKEIEKNHFELFKNLLQDFPSGEVIQGENPDFLVKNNTSTIGIEHIQLIIKKESKAFEEMLKKIVNLAQKYYKSQNWPNIYANFIGNNCELKKAEYDEIAKKIAYFVFSEVSKNIYATNDYYIRPYELLEKAPEMKKELEKISELIDSVHIKINNESFWNVSGGGFMESDCIKIIQSRIDDKLKKLSDYKKSKKCNTYWLLIVADSVPSSWIKKNGKVLNHVYTSDFGRTYLLNCTFNSLDVLNTRKNKV